MNARGYIPGIDSLRAVAVLSVMLYHLHAAWLPGGYVGVDVFFVISGYVVSASLVRDEPGRLRSFIARFYARRLIRIYPALLLCLLCTFVLSVLFLPSSWLSGTAWKTGLLAFAGFGNVALVWLSDGYFSPRVEFNPFTHTWSLGVEEQFYLLYPLLFYLWLQQRRKRPMRAGGLIAAVAVASLLWCVHTSQQAPVSAFYLLPSRFWELAAGALLFQCHHAGRGLIGHVRGIQVALLVGLTLIGTAFVVTSVERFPFPGALLPVAGSALCIAAAVSAARRGGGSLLGFEHGALTYLGRASYSLYLWHWPVYVLFRWTVGLDTVATAAAALLCVFAAALLSYHLVEVPLRRALPQWRRPHGWFISRGIALIVVCTAAAAALAGSLQWTSLSVVNRHSEDWYPVAQPVAESVRAAATGRLKDRRLFVVGDSHVSAYDVMLRLLERNEGVVVQQHWQAGCTAAMLLQPSSADCRAFLDDALDQVARSARRGDVVFLPGLRVPRLSDQWASFDRAAVVAAVGGVEAGAQRAAALPEALALVGRLEQMGLRVLIEAPKPVFPAPPFRCADWFNRNNPVCRQGLTVPLAEFRQLAAPTYAALATLRQAHPGLRVWDPLPLLCRDDPCTPLDGPGRALFFDGDHLSALGNRRLYAAFAQTLKATFADLH